MYVIAGLGNPGKQYDNTRHNIGFMTIDRLAEQENIDILEKKHKAVIGKGTISVWMWDSSVSGKREVPEDTTV